MDRLAEGRWIVGVDGSDSSRRALEWAVAHATTGTEISVIRAWTPPVYSTSGMGPVVQVGVEIADMEESLKEHTDELVRAVPNPDGVTIEASVRRGGAAGVLLGATEGASLLVVGNRGNGGFGRLLLGSVSTQCATHARVPTVVVPDVDEIVRSRSFLVGFDGSANSIAAIAAAVALADDDSAITAVGIAATTTILLPYPDIAAKAERELDAFHEESLQQAAEAANVDRSRIERRFERGVVERKLLEMSLDHDLMVMGARGQGALASAILGSVSTWLLHHLRRPMMIVPNPPAGD